MKTQRIAAATLLLLLAFPTWSTPASLDNHRSRQSIGLALAGGGARGLSHLGILRWLEEHHIPVDHIAGTSMGGLIAGLYASGRDSAEMMEFIDSINWVDLLRGGPAYSELSFRRKEDQRAYPNDLELGFRKGFRFPAGLNSGHKVGLLLDEVAFPYSNVESFDDLPTPFRCVAADLLSAEEIVFKSGSLSRALRATMSIPGVFEPVRDGDRLLVDGGILNNLPVDVVKEMGADLIIAVDLGYPKATVEEFDSPLSVISRSLDVMIQANVTRNLKLANITLKPNLTGYNTFSFDLSKEIIDQGYKEAERQYPSLIGLSLDETSWQEYLRNRRNRRRNAQSRPGFVTVDGVAPADQSRAGRLFANEVGVPLVVKKINDDLTKITGWGRYQAAGYTRKEVSGQEGLDVQVQPKSYGPLFIKPSIEVNGAQISDIKFTVASRLTFYDILHSNSEWRTDLSFGFRNLAATEFYRPLGKTRFFLAPKARVSRVNQNIYFNEDRVADYIVSNFGVGVDLGYSLGQTSEIRIGYDLGEQRGRTGVGDPRIPSFSGRVNSLTGKWQLERLDDPIIPTRGVRMKVQGWWYPDTPGDLPQFPQAETRMLFAQPLNQRLSALISIQGGTTFHKEAPFAQKFILGGPLQLGALGFQELRGDHYFYSSVGLLHTLSEKPAALLGKISAIGFYEVGDAFDSKANPFNDVAAGLLSRTKLGVLFFGASVGESGRHKFFFSLGGLF